MRDKWPEQRPYDATGTGAQAPPRVEISDREDGVCIHVNLQGVSADEVTVRVTDNGLDISRDQKLARGPKAGSQQVDIIGSSYKFRRCLQILNDAAATDLNVLLCGETGTGKEIFARAIHLQSSRAQENFVSVDCTALPETIIGSILFGHAKGAFTGATQASRGLLSEAHRGTLFLDEVGELSLAQQKSFLRVLQEKSFKPIGSCEEVNSDFRLIAATNRDLSRRVSHGLFRQDLYYRLKSYMIELPPLRERSDDISLLAHFHLRDLCQKHDLPLKQMDSEFLQVLTKYQWPGNIRELVNTLEQSLFIAQQEPILFTKHLPQHIRIQVAKSALRDRALEEHTEAFNANNIPHLTDFRCDIFFRAEKEYLSRLVRQTGQNISAACSLSGLSRSRLYTLLKKHQLTFH